VATLEDYRVVRELVADLISEASERSVSPTIRETVAAVAAQLSAGEPFVSVADLAKRLGLDKSAASRRYRAAAQAGYLENTETRKGHTAKIELGELLPEDRELLPHPEVLTCCSDLKGGRDTPLPSLDNADGAGDPDSLELF